MPLRSLIGSLRVVAAIVFTNVLAKVEGVALQQNRSRWNAIEKVEPANEDLDPGERKAWSDFKRSDESSLSSFPGSADGDKRTRSVWLVLNIHQATHEFLFLPIIATVKEAFEGTGAYFYTVFAQDNACDFERALQTNMHEEDSLLPVVIAFEWFMLDKDVATCVRGSYKNLLTKVQKQSYLILYNDEPTIRTGEGGVLLREAAVKVSASEVWSYSWFMSDYAKAGLASHNIISRALPAGCGKGMDYGFPATSEEGARNLSQVGFLGAWEDRPEDVHKALESGLGDRIVTESHAKTATALRDYLARCPRLQINPHSFRNPTGQAMESFRISVLVMNGACIVSEPVHPLDAEKFQGVVRFELASNFGPATRELLDNSDTLATCNAEAKQIYCTNFAPDKLLSDSGFTALMEKMP